jgi:hypothetical protein
MINKSSQHSSSLSSSSSSSSTGSSSSIENTVNRLNDDVIIHILSFLPYKSLYTSTTIINHRFNHITNSNILYKIIINHRCPSLLSSLYEMKKPSRLSLSLSLSLSSSDFSFKRIIARLILQTRTFLTKSNKYMKMAYYIDKICYDDVNKKDDDEIRLSYNFGIKLIGECIYTFHHHLPLSSDETEVLLLSYLPPHTFIVISFLSHYSLSTLDIYDALSLLFHNAITIPIYDNRVSLSRLCMTISSKFINESKHKNKLKYLDRCSVDVMSMLIRDMIQLNIRMYTSYNDHNEIKKENEDVKKFIRNVNAMTYGDGDFDTEYLTLIYNQISTKSMFPSLRSHVMSDKEKKKNEKKNECCIS